jgi:exopolysaccharide biosynthesis predicted pyruvyltransferase EpsI
MLLTKEDYMELVVKDRIPKSKGTLMTYILDKAGWKNELIHQMADKVKLTPFSVMPNEAFSKAGKKHLEECIFPPVTEWIRGFMDAEFVITDSFHGTVFAILFNKQFLCLGNNDRGLTRMTSLLDKMELADRLICEEDKNKKLHELKAIDYQKVNQIIEREKIKSMDFLENALSQNN